MVLLLCFRFTITNTSASTLLDHEVRDRQRVESFPIQFLVAILKETSMCHNLNKRSLLSNMSGNEDMEFFAQLETFHVSPMVCWVMHDYMHEFSCQLFPTVFLFSSNSGTSKILNCEAYFRFHCHLVCSRLHRTSSTLIMIFVSNMPGTLQENFGWQTRR